MGGIAGALKAWRGTNEVISTLLLNFVAIGLVSLAVHEQSLLRQPATSAQTLPNSPPLPEATHLALLPLSDGSQGTMGIVIAALVLVAVSVLVRRSAFGLKLRSVALGKQAASRAGIGPVPWRFPHWRSPGAPLASLGVCSCSPPRSSCRTGSRRGTGFRDWWSGSWLAGRPGALRWLRCCSGF